MQARSTSPSWASCAAGVAEQLVHRLGLGGGLDQAEQHLGLRRPALLRPAGPGLGQGDGELRGDLAEQVRAAAAAGSTVRTPTTSPSRISGWPCAERMPRSRELPVGGPPAGGVGLRPAAGRG